MTTNSRPIRRCVALLATSMLLISMTATAASNLPLEQKGGTISYISGGIGSDEIAAMKAAAASYSLELVFVARDETGHETYLAGTGVVIRNARDEVVLSTQSDGPFLLARLPAGSYRVVASDQDQVRERRVLIDAGKHRRVVFVW